ncbi:MAG: hypothetical protein ABEJ87_05180 [Candidatus Nanohalobium sp.]
MLEPGVKTASRNKFGDKLNFKGNYRKEKSVEYTTAETYMVAENARPEEGLDIGELTEIYDSMKKEKENYRKGRQKSAEKLVNRYIEERNVSEGLYELNIDFEDVTVCRWNFENPEADNKLLLQAENQKGNSEKDIHSWWKDQNIIYSNEKVNYSLEEAKQMRQKLRTEDHRKLATLERQYQKADSQYEREGLARDNRKTPELSNTLTNLRRHRKKALLRLKEKPCRNR